MLLAMKDEARGNLNEEENDFMLDNHYGDDSLEELNAAVIMMVCIQPAENNDDAEPKHNAKTISESLSIILVPCFDGEIVQSRRKPELMDTQLWENIYVAGSETRPPILNKENYVSWSTRLLRYAKSKPNGKLIYNSIMNGSYVRRMIPEPGDPDREVPVAETFHEQTDDELTEKENVENQNWLIVVSGIANQNVNSTRNGNVVAARVEGNGNGNQNSEIEEVNANYILKANLQQASTSGTQTDKAPVYDSDRSAKVPQKVDETNDLSNPVTSNSLPITKERSVVKNDNVIAPGMFRINPSKTYREDKFVPINQARASVRTNSITISQPHVITKKDINSDSNGLSSTGVDNTAKTRRPQRRSNTKNDRVPSTSKNSFIKNKEVEVEEHHRNFLLSKNKKHMPSECNNIKLAIRNDKSEVVCAMCKQCLFTSNHDVCMLKYVNAMNSCGDKHSVNVSKTSNKRKHKPTSKKSKKKFLGTVRFRNDHIAAILGYDDLQWGNILITMVYFVKGLGHNLFLVGQFCDSDLEVAFRRNTCFVRNIEGVDLLKENRSTNLYTINLHEMAFASPICLMARASSTKSWL
nr:integrase, catalytic region, zinc finger, CCHC-type, peptidase aspartic, catalytic [Tanacetum cinerariifolium]